VFFNILMKDSFTWDLIIKCMTTFSGRSSSGSVATVKIDSVI
jgi:hypothetical protein